MTHADIVTLSTLAANTALKQAQPIGITEDFRIISMELSAEMTGLTAGEGPIDLYLCNDELSVTEISESILGPGPVDRSDRNGQERAERAVFLIGHFSGLNTESPVLGHDGQEGIVKKTIRWTFSNANGFVIVAFNRSGGTLTTGAVIRFSTKFYGVWLM